VTDQLPQTEMHVSGYRRTTEHKPQDWFCVHCRAKTNEPRLPGAYLPYYCEVCRPEVKRTFDRLRQRDYRAGKRITQALETLEALAAPERVEQVERIRADLIDLLEQVVNSRASFAEQTYLYCGDCGYRYQKDDRLDKHCPGCGVTPLAARSHALLRLSWSQFWHRLVDRCNQELAKLPGVAEIDLATYSLYPDASK